MNIHVQAVCMYFVLDIYLGVLLGHITPCLNFEELVNGFSKWLHHFTFPPAVHQGSTFSVSSVFDSSTLMDVRWYHGTFDLRLINSATEQ